MFAPLILTHTLIFLAWCARVGSFVPHARGILRRSPRRQSIALCRCLKNLPAYLEDSRIDPQLQEVICSVADACADISTRLQKLPIDNAAMAKRGENLSLSDFGVNIHGEKQKGMDIAANDLFINHVKGSVAAMASEEEDDIIFGEREGIDGEISYEVAFDPLDGSSNLEISIPTGTIFGIASYNRTAPFSSPGRALLAAGYSVYSSSFEFVLSLGVSGSMGAAGFTFDPTREQQNRAADRFILTRPSILCPSHGPYYSLNSGREPDWPEGLKRWIHDAKRGHTPSGTVFSARYVCSLCADVHRTLIKGGWAGNPRPHLRLLYEAAPLAAVAEACQGRGSDGKQNILDIVPEGLHDRVHVFIGSAGDVLELEAYGDVQQTSKTYHA
mmetsp:Transcript_6983/g.20940  ORF Transcript_6983/g.20940 Transcript_6983/m.20940 type:complete len:386 (-) Transcript_6983:206-1363(-)